MILSQRLLHRRNAFSLCGRNIGGDDKSSRFLISEIISKYTKIPQHSPHHNFFCACPFHVDTKPSLSINNSMGVYYCFSCLRSGSIVTFLSDIENISYEEAKKKLAEIHCSVHGGLVESFDHRVYQPRLDNFVKSSRSREPSTPIRKKTLSISEKKTLELYQLLDSASKYYTYELMKGSKAGGARQYIQSRGIKAKTVQRYQMGYAPKVTFPAHAVTKHNSGKEGGIPNGYDTSVLSPLQKHLLGVVSVSNKDVNVALAELLRKIVECGLATVPPVEAAEELGEVNGGMTLIDTGGNTEGSTVVEVGEDEGTPCVVSDNDSHEPYEPKQLKDKFQNRLMIPIRNHDGHVVAFGGRQLGFGPVNIIPFGPKYLNSASSALFQKSSVLFGLYEAMASVQETGQLIMVEGYFDVISLHNDGVENVVASMGTAITSEQIFLAAKHVTKNWTSKGSIIILMDEDEAGGHAIARLCQKVLPLIMFDRNATSKDENAQMSDVFSSEPGGLYVLEALVSIQIGSLKVPGIPDSIKDASDLCQFCSEDRKGNRQIVSSKDINVDNHKGVPTASTELVLGSVLTTGTPRTSHGGEGHGCTYTSVPDMMARIIAHSVPWRSHKVAPSSRNCSV